MLHKWKRNVGEPFFRKKKGHRRILIRFDCDGAISDVREIDTSTFNFFY